MVPEFWKLLPDQSIGFNSAYIPLNKAENVEDFIQPTSDKPDPDPVLISAYVTDTWHRFSLFVPPLTVSSPPIIWYA